jgi:DNA-binding NtrC family response regulator
MGSDRERVVDVRFLAATNREPEEMISKGILRRDLFYRLGVVIRIPPLRERRDEIIPLARHFIAHFCGEFARPLMQLAPAAEPILQRHRWVGNIRELRNVIERAVMTTPGDEIGPDALDIVTSGAGSSLSPEVRRRSSMNALQAISIPPPPPGTVAASGLPAAARAAAEQVERQRILEVLKVVGGSRSRAAVTLGVSRSTLYEKLKRYAIE